MSKESVYAAPIRKLQEEHYAQLLALRDGYYKTVKEVIDMAEQGGKADNAGSSGDGNEEMDKLAEENKKLNYRITHLLRVLEEQDKKE